MSILHSSETSKLTLNFTWNFVCGPNTDQHQVPKTDLEVYATFKHFWDKEIKVKLNLKFLCNWY